MSYDEAVEAAAEALSRLWGEGGFASNDELARTAIDAALPHLRNGYDREAIAEALERAAEVDGPPEEDVYWGRQADAVIEVLRPLDAPTDPAPERRGAVRALREAAAGEGLPDTLSRKYPKGHVRDWLLNRARRIER